MDSEFVAGVQAKFAGLPPMPDKDDKTPGAINTRRAIAASVLDMAVHTACVALEQGMREQGVKGLLEAKPAGVTADEYTKGLVAHGFSLFAAITGKGA
jgi:hypothetical protein